MTHVEARNALLIAEPDELRGLGETPLAQHIRSCAECRAAATRILAVTAMLSAELTASARVHRKPVRSRVWPVWLALPVAAAISGIALVRTSAEVRPPRDGAIADVQRPVSTPVVNTPPNRNVAVFKAAENITVVWDLGAKSGS
jgi:hypothetical protein